MAFFTLRVLVYLYSKVLVDHPNLILAFRGVIPLNVGPHHLGIRASILKLGFYLLSLCVSSGSLNLILAFWGVVPLNVGSRDLIPCWFASSWYPSFNFKIRCISFITLCFYFLSLVCLVLFFILVVKSKIYFLSFLSPLFPSPDFVRFLPSLHLSHHHI